MVHRMCASLAYLAGMAAGGWVAVVAGAPEIGALISGVAWMAWIAHAQSWAGGDS